MQTISSQTSDLLGLWTRYKTNIAKILALRIIHVIYEVISDCQSVFILGRQILDNSMLANKIVNSLRRQHV